MEDIKEYNEEGNCVYEILNGIECWREFDERGNKIHSKCSDGYEEWNKYDDNDNIIHFIDSSSCEYLKKANISRCGKYESWAEYDENNNCIYFKNSFGAEYWWKLKNGEKIDITKQKIEEIKEKEFLSRKECSRFELMEM